MSRRTVKWEEMFPDEMDQAVQDHPLLYLPYGMCEPHGFHAALGLDGIKAYEICVRAAEEGGGVVAPLTLWHIGEQGIGVPWLERQDAPQPYITAIGHDLFVQGVIWHLRAAVARGFEAVIAMTGHYGGTECDIRSAIEVFTDYVPLPVWGLADWECIGYGDYKGDHAGPCETSQLWALRPDLVDVSRLPEYEGEGRIYASALKPGQASRLEGERIVESQVRNLVEGGNRLLEQSPGKLEDPGPDGAREICAEMMSRAQAGDIEWVYLMDQERHSEFWSAEGEGGRYRARTIESDGAML
jgi:creatinine amidohydrolase